MDPDVILKQQSPRPSLPVPESQDEFELSQPATKRKNRNKVLIYTK